MYKAAVANDSSMMHVGRQRYSALDKDHRWDSSLAKQGNETNETIVGTSRFSLFFEAITTDIADRLVVVHRLLLSAATTMSLLETDATEKEFRSCRQ